jgi:hypothetical protein
MMKVQPRMIPLCIGEIGEDGRWLGEAQPVGAFVNEDEWLAKCDKYPSRFSMVPVLTAAEYYAHFPIHPEMKALIFVPCTTGCAISA